MQRCFVLVVVLFLGLLSARVAAVNPVKAFPTAEGFGAYTVGGRGGRVIEVTNLNDSGPGSLRDCAENTGPRTCVFRVGGTINLQSGIFIWEPNSYLTIAGQTAPGDGILITPWPIYITYGAHDVIVRHIRHRQGFASPPPSFNGDCGNLFVFAPSIAPVYNVILDHVSVAYACDDSVQGYGTVTNVTYQWMLIGDAYHDWVDGFGGSKGFIGGGIDGASDEISFHHNLLVHLAGRNPDMGPVGVFDYRNNIVYNWLGCIGNIELGLTNDHVQTSLPSNINFVGNKYIPGANSNTTDCWLGTLWSTAVTKIYQQDNQSPFCPGSQCSPNEWNIGWGDGMAGTYPASESTYRVFTPFPAPPITMTPLSQLDAVLAQNVGATKPARDSLDARLINEWQTRTGLVGRMGAPFPVLNGGTPPADSDHDGMPDSWESAHGLNPNNADDGPQTASNGYTNLENYLNELAGDSVPATRLVKPTNLRIVTQ